MTPTPLANRIRRVLAPLACLLVLCIGCSDPQPPTVPLYRALQLGDLDQVKRHLAHGGDINGPDGAGDYPLHVAVRNAQIAILRLLLDHGARVDVVDRSGRTPLQVALAGGRTELAEILFAAGAAQSPQSLLFALVRDGSADRDALTWLRRHGADLNAVDDLGLAPLHLAVEARRVALAKRLILAGADPNLPTAGGQTPLALAQRIGDAALLRVLQQYGASSLGSEPAASLPAARP